MPNEGLVNVRECALFSVQKVTPCGWPRTQGIVLRCGARVNYVSLIPFDGVSSGMGVLG